MDRGETQRWSQAPRRVCWWGTGPPTLVHFFYILIRVDVFPSAGRGSVPGSAPVRANLARQGAKANPRRKKESKRCAAGLTVGDPPGQSL
jgi:hypothetical protein